jgi:hypothetical protein
MQEPAMSLESIIVVGLITIAFSAFAIALAVSDYSSRDFRPSWRRTATPAE